MRRSKRVIMAAALLFLTVGQLLSAGEITVAVAANVSYAMEDLKRAFMQKHPETKIRVIVGSSGKLTAQIRRGAPFGLFMSADMGYPEALHKAGLALEEPKIYARGTLALFSLKPRDLSRGLQTLTDPNIRRIAIANPKTAPYGKAAAEALRRSGLYDTLRPKLIFAESVSQTVAYAMTAADAGFVAKSALFSEKLRRYRTPDHFRDVDPALYTPIAQGIVLLKRAKGDNAYRAFYDFVLGPDAAAIFRRYGYLLP